jgi:3-dehydroquinate synthetase
MTPDHGNGNTLAYRVNQIERIARELAGTVEQAERMLSKHDEQINGDRGLSKAIDQLSGELNSLRRAIWTVGGGIVISAVGFAFTVLTVFS